MSKRSDQQTNCGFDKAGQDRQFDEIKNKKNRLTFKNNRGIGSDQHRTSSRTTRGPCGTFSVDGNVTGEDDSVPSVPGRRFDPVDCVENCGGGAIASVLAVNTLNVEVARVSEEVHKDGLD